MAFSHPAPKSILITGASSGIGEALACAYAAPGITLFLCGRNETRVASVVAACTAKGAVCYGHCLDVTDGKACLEWITACDTESPLDLVVANAGIAGGSGGMGESPEKMREIHQINVMGTINTVLPTIAAMVKKGGGQIAIVSSVAAFVGFLGAGAPAYCASKAANRAWGESLRGALAPQGIKVSVICPGFVRSRITEINKFPMPFFMEADQAAAIIRHGLAKNRARIIFPWQMAVLVKIISALPVFVAERLGRYMIEKRG